MKKNSFLVVLILTVATFSATYEFLTIQDLKTGTLANGQSVTCETGDIAKIAGYYTAGDGAAHSRIYSIDTTSSSIEVGGKYWNIIPVNGEVSTLWYGLDGRSTPQSDLLEDALNSGYKITSPPGFTYLIDRTLNIYAPKFVLDFNSSTIKCSDTFVPDTTFIMLNLAYAKEGDGLNLPGTTIKNNNSPYDLNWYIKVSNTRFDGNSANTFNPNSTRNAALLIGTSNVTIENCHFREIPGTKPGYESAAILVLQGIYIFGGEDVSCNKPEYLNFLNNVFVECLAEPFGENLIGAIFSQGERNIIKGNIIKKFSDTPIALNGSTHSSIISDNLIQNQRGWGIALEDGSQNTIITNNVIKECGTGGISLIDFAVSEGGIQDYHNITISNNVISKSLNDGSLICKGIAITTDKKNGMVANDITISNNLVEDIDMSHKENVGVQLLGSNITFSNNRVNVSGHAIKFGGSSITINDNSITSIDSSALRQSGTLNNVKITDNKLSAAEYGLLLLSNQYTGGLTFSQNNLYTPLGDKEIADPGSNFLTGRASVNKLLCNNEGAFVKELRYTNKITIAANSKATIVLDDSKAWDTKSSTITNISTLTGNNVVNNVSGRFYNWANAGQTIVVMLENHSFHSVTLDGVVVRVEGTRVY